MLHEPSDKFIVEDPTLKLAAWRSQAFWGTTVWVHETLIGKSLELRHFYILASLTDREAKIVAGLDIDPMPSSRLTEQLQRQFADEYDGEREVGGRTADSDKKFLKEKGMIYHDDTVFEGKKRGWRVTEKSLNMMNDIADDLGSLAITQAKELQKLLPEKGAEMTEKDGFYNRIKAFFKNAKMANAIPAIALATIVATANVAEAGPRDFADGTLTLPLVLQQY